MGTRVIPAIEFQANPLELFDEVATTGDEILVTSGGRVVARVIPPEGYMRPAGERLLTAEELLGTVAWDNEEDLVGPTGEPLPGEGRERNPPAVVDLSHSILYEGDLVSFVWSPLTTDTHDYRI